MRIRRFRPDDLPALIDCAARAWEETYPAKPGVRRREAREYFATFARRLGDRLFDERCDVLADDGEIVGYATYSRAKVDDWIYDLEEFGIRPDRQGRGLGKKLLRYAIAAVARKKYSEAGRSDRLRHLALVTTNPIAERLYASCGGRVIERAEIAGKTRTFMMISWGAESPEETLTEK